MRVVVSAAQSDLKQQVSRLGPLPAIAEPANREPVQPMESVCTSERKMSKYCREN